MERVLSTPRFDSYRKNGETPEEAFCKYLWNARLCESLYPSLHFLEVAFRNAVHAEISKSCGDCQWLLSRHRFLDVKERDKITNAEEGLRIRKQPITEPYLISELGFGFWTSLLDARYDVLWHQIIIGVFPHMLKSIRTRKTASRLMNEVRRLRNAALHHHSIWHWGDLREQHENIHTLLGYICTSIALMAKRVDRFKTTHSGTHTQFASVLNNLPS